MSKRIFLSLTLAAALILTGCSAPSSSKSAGSSNSWKLNASGVIPMLDRAPYDTPSAPESSLSKTAGSQDDLPF